LQPHASITFPAEVPSGLRKTDPHEGRPVIFARRSVAILWISDFRRSVVASQKSARGDDGRALAGRAGASGPGAVAVAHLLDRPGLFLAGG
jgi:hypothetical protein